MVTGGGRAAPPPYPLEGINITHDDTFRWSKHIFIQEWWSSTPPDHPIYVLLKILFSRRAQPYQPVHPTPRRDTSDLRSFENLFFLGALRPTNLLILPQGATRRDPLP